jgi:hypothetical protein
MTLIIFAASLPLAEPLILLILADYYAIIISFHFTPFDISLRHY